MIQPILSKVAPSAYDERDYKYAPKEVTVTRADLRSYAGAVEFQDKIGSCTANSVVSACEIHLQRENKFNDLSRLFLYYGAREMRNLLGQEGAYLRDALKCGYRYGICLEEYWPYDISKVDIRPSDEAYAQALSSKITRYEFIETTSDKTKIDGIRSAIVEGFPVVIAMPITEEFYELKGDLDTQNYHGVGYTNVVGHHAMCIVGFDDEKQYFIVENSWSYYWGDKGYFALPYAIIRDVYELWTVNKFKSSYERSTKEKIKDFFYKYRARLPIVAGIILVLSLLIYTIISGL